MLLKAMAEEQKKKQKEKTKGAYTNFYQATV